MPRSFPSDPLSCTERAVIPQIDQVTNAKWSASSRTLAISRFRIAPSSRTITGYKEEQVITELDLGSGAVRDLGPGRLPEWSGSGSFLSYWSPTGYLHLNRNGAFAGRLDATIPDVRWKGDDLYFWYEDEIRVWNAGVTRTVARVQPEFAPLYPRDDVYFSADAERFSITRYSMDGTVERYLGVTGSGEITVLDEPDATLTEWSPKGQALLVWTSDRVILHENGSKRVGALSELTGNVQGWTADGRLLIGAVSPAVPGGNIFDRIPVWTANEAQGSFATLPNLLGARAFSPDGRWFAGVSRTGLSETRLELYRCGVAGDTGGTRAEPASRSRVAGVDSGPRRFVRPVAGAVTQFLQGYHTGIDIAAPFGSLIVAADEGTVTEVGWVHVGGRRVCLQHADALESCYYHSSATLVSVGDRVAQGQPIARIGMTGATTGPHLHWEVKQDGRIVDPLAH
jgi:murein DD-endopeptidase MepM/ murein hydrolase activator NlpD